MFPLINSLPMVWLDEVCWHEMDINDELKLRTTTKFCQKIEAQLRQTIYQWEHIQGDMVVESIIYSPLAIYNSGIGINREMDIVKTDEKNDVVSRHFYIQIKDFENIEDIKMPAIAHDENLSKLIYERYKYCAI